MKSNIESVYRENTGDRVLQGDIFNNLSIPIFSDNELNLIESYYSVVLSQDCDLNQDYDAWNAFKDNDNIESINNKRIPSILLCPAYPANQVREGVNLEFLDLPMSKISHPSKTPWKKIIQNETPRYHFLSGVNDFEIPDLVLDFKRYYTVSRDYLYSVYDDFYVASLNELYREDLSLRFSNYFSRVGLPNLE